MRTIIVLPIEPLAERYTEQWYRRFPEAFRAAGYDVQVIDGQPLLDNEIKVGAFLDINSTVAYKMSQLQAIAGMFHRREIADGTIFFFGDIEFWGLESVRLMADMNGIKIKMTGFLHAASYTMEDAFAIAAPYQRYTEVGWLAAMDKVFVGSVYHKRAIHTRRLVQVGAEPLGARIKVTGNPLFVDEYHDFGPLKKQKKVLLTNRFDHEKRPVETLRMFHELKCLHPDWEFVVTTGRQKLRGRPEDVAYANKLADIGVITIKEGLTKEQYHRELAESYMMVSHSIEENYGYCIAESIFYGCIPVLREGMSHNELVPPACLFVGDIEGPDVKLASHWMQQFDEPIGLTFALNTNGMQNILNEIASLS